jgi:D-xylose transport system ATP-binding protein
MTMTEETTQRQAEHSRPLCERRNIRVAYGGVHAVEDVSIDVHAGEVMGLVGGNGAGKSTLMRALSGAHRADSGEILIDGKPVAITNPRDAKAYNIECIYQTLALADNVDAPANVFLGRELTTAWGTLDDGAMEDATRKVMARLNPNFRRFTTPVRSLSGGQRQAVAIARAIYWNARLMIMDEPTNNLGVPEQRKVLDLIRTLRDQRVPVILISHTLPDVFAVTDRIVVMHRGRKVAEMPTSETDSQEVVEYMVGARQQAAAA